MEIPRLTVEDFLNDDFDGDTGSSELVLDYRVETILRNMRAQSLAQLTQIPISAAGDAEKSMQMYVTKQYEVQFIEHLLELSADNKAALRVNNEE